jgi:iron complex outermembrane recepter protein
MNRRLHLVSTLLFLSCMPLAAHADPVAAPAPTSDASAAAPASTPAPAQTGTLEEVLVLGQSETRQVQRVTKAQINEEPAGTSPLKMLQDLPGVHFASDDPLGTDEWSSRITIRGFDHTQLGYTLDGVPMGNNDFHTGDGLSPSRVWIGENLKAMELAQGAGASATASTSNEGGTVELFTDDPNAKAGVRADQTLGSYRFKRSYLRADSGDIDGFKAYLSGVYVDAPKWKGNDSQQQKQINGKLSYTWGWGRIDGLIDVAYRNEMPYLDLSKQTLNRCGYYFDYIEPNWQQAINFANQQYSGCVQTQDDTYYAGNELRHDQLDSLHAQFDLTENLTLNNQIYYHHNRSQGHWYAPKDDLPYTPAPDDAPIALRLSHYLMEREGQISSLAYETGSNFLEAGWWFEHSDYNFARSFQPIPGPGASPGAISQNVYYSSYDEVLFGQRFVTVTSQWYLRDTLTLLDQRLKIDASFKGHDITTNASSQQTGLAPGAVPRANGALTAKSYFLPQIGADYIIGSGFETFASYSMNQNAFEPGANGAWSGTQATFDGLQVRPERSATTELGMRYIAPQLQASVALYNVDFSNRLLVIVPCNGATSCPNQIANVGRVTTRGTEATLIWKPLQPLRWFNSFTYNDSTYRNNYIDSSSGYTNGEVPVKGKTVVDAPKELFASELSYRLGIVGLSGQGQNAGELRFNFGTKYTSARYYTYVNDQRIGGFWLTDAGLSWENPRIGPLHDLKVALTVSNLLDVKYIATINSNGFATNDPDGSFATLLVGAPRELFVTVDGRF